MSLIKKQINSNLKQEQNESIISREDLLLTAVTIATSTDRELKNKLIVTISKLLGSISDKDYAYMAEHIIRLPEEKARQINTFLGKNLEGFNYQHNNHYALFYGL